MDQVSQELDGLITAAPASRTQRERTYAQHAVGMSGIGIDGVKRKGSELVVQTMLGCSRQMKGEERWLAPAKGSFART